MKITCLFCYFIFCCLHLSIAQSLPVTGRIMDSQTHQPISFATVGIKGKSIGTVSNEQGNFTFTAPEGQLQANDLIIFSSIGYQSLSLPYHAFKSGNSVALSPVTTQLKEVAIKPQKVKEKVYGRTGNSVIMVSTMYTQKQLIDDNLGKEQAAILSIDDNCYLKSFNMYVAFNRFKNVKFRLNLYNVKNGRPDSLIINHNILFDVSQKHGWVNVDLKPYNIYLTGYRKIAVAIQWLKSEKLDSTSHAFSIAATMSPTHAMFFRDKSQSEWNKIGNSNVSFNIVADYFKGDRKGAQETMNENEEAPALDDSLKNLIAYTKYAEEAASSPYGRNTSAGHHMHLTDATIYYEIYGKGEPLLLLHGNSQSISAFYKQIAEFAKHYQVIAVDTRAQGRSTDSLNHDLTYQLFADDMKQLLDTLHLKKANIVGWSDGGNTGLMMALNYPAHINKLVVMGANLFPQGVEPGLLNRLQTEASQNKDPAAQQAINRQRLLKLLITQPQLKFEQLQTIQAPTLIMAGERDVILPEHTKNIASHIPHAQLLIFKNATHYAPQEVPEEFNKAVLNFLK